MLNKIKRTRIGWLFLGFSMCLLVWKLSSDEHSTDHTDSITNKWADSEGQHSDSQIEVSNGPTYVVLFAYPRTGSSFTGELFNRNPRAFYLYEPLHYLFRILSHPRPLQNEHFDNDATQVMTDVFNCHFNQTSSDLILDRVLYRNSLTFSLEASCLKTSNPVNDCASRLTRVCQSRNLRVFKILRSTMESVAELFKERTLGFNNIKVIHLLRDPRGHINSMNKNIRHRNGTLDLSRVQKICQRSLKDLSIQRELSLKYPGNVLEVHYEDIASRPFEMADKIYDFVQKTFAPEEVKSWLKQSTAHTDLSKETHFGTERRNSTETANAWRKELPPTMVKQIDQRCLAYYEKSQYYKPIYVTLS